MIFHQNRLLADDSYEISYLIFLKIRKYVAKFAGCCSRDWHLKMISSIQLIIILSYDVTTGSDIMPCIKSIKPLVVPLDQAILLHTIVVVVVVFMFNTPPTTKVIWRRGHDLVSSDRLVKLGIKPATPGFQGEQFIHYTMVAATYYCSYVLLNSSC